MSHVDALSRAPVGDEEETECSDGLTILTTQLTTNDWLVAAQLTDARIVLIKEQLLKKKSLTKDDKKIQDEYALANDRVFKKITKENEPDKMLWVVPARARYQIVKLHHDDTGHFSADKTCSKIKEHYWFPRMRRYVKRYISACLQCLYHKTPGGKKQGMLHAIDKIGEPFHTIHIDHLGPFVKSTKNNAYLIVAIDGFTKFTLLRAVRNTCMQAARKFIQDLMGIFGAPTRIISDQGTSYTGKAFRTICKEAKIIHVKNATATPRGNGQVERLNRTLTPMISSLSTRDDERDWDARIHQIQWSINNTEHKTTKRTPFALLMNFHSQNPSGDRVTAAIRQSFDPVITTQRQDALQRIMTEQDKLRKRYNEKRATAETYHPGDLVVVERDAPATGQSRKMAPKYRGPYVITKKLNFDRYQIEDLPEAQRSQRFYRNIAPVDKLKRFQIVTANSDSDDSNEFDTDDDDYHSTDDDHQLNQTATSTASSAVPVSNVPTDDMTDDLTNSEDDNEAVQRPRRERRTPKHLKDFVLQ